VPGSGTQFGSRLAQIKKPVSVRRESCEPCRSLSLYSAVRLSSSEVNADSVRSSEVILR
jgi:hypothetical protein